MTRPPIAEQATVLYCAETPPGAPLEGFPVALVAGRTSTLDDLYRLLRQRLRILTTILVIAFLLGLGIGLLAPRYGSSQDIMQHGAGPRAWLASLWRHAVALSVLTPCAVLLWRTPPRSVSGLRVIEIVIVGACVLLLLVGRVMPDVYQFLEEAAREPEPARQALVGRYVHISALLWFALIVMYGTLIPNTWQRCAGMVTVMGLSPLVVFAAYGLWLRPLQGRIVVDVLVTLGLWNSIAAALVIFASSRVEILRRQAAEARRLGQYVLRERLGSGGMGEVYRAEHVLMRRPCALKVIRPERAGDPQNLRRFEREVQLTATLTHPNTIQIFDYGHAENGTFYYVMEYLPGLTLDELVTRHGPLPAARAIHFLRQVCAALHEAHGQGLIHRDIKPGNVMICERGGTPDVVKLLDFGLVLPVIGDSNGDKLTMEGAVAGTPGYLSPEQAGGATTIDARSDIYSVGALGYFLLTGQPPFAGRSGVKLLAAHLYEPPEPPSTRCRDIPADIEAVVLRCLAKHPAERYPDVATLGAALAACEAGGDWSAADAGQWWSRQRSTAAPA